MEKYDIFLKIFLYEYTGCNGIILFLFFTFVISLTYYLKKSIAFRIYEFHYSSLSELFIEFIRR